MAIEYLGLSEINGPLIALEGVKDAAFDEIVEFSINDGAEKRLGRIIEIYEDKAIIQVFEDYVLSIQYFNQVINAKPYLYSPAIITRLRTKQTTVKDSHHIIRLHLDNKVEVFDSPVIISYLCT